VIAIDEWRSPGKTGTERQAALDDRRSSDVACVPSPSRAAEGSRAVWAEPTGASRGRIMPQENVTISIKNSQIGANQFAKWKTKSR
jgi:hypothetical protein